MVQNLVRKWFQQIGVNELTDNDVLNVIRCLKLDRLNPRHLFILNMISPLIFMIIQKLNDDVIDWGDLNETPE